MGHLHALWHDALEQQEDGDLTKWSDELIAESSQFDGDAPQYVSLLQQYGWLDGRLIHDWLEYSGGYLAGKYHTSNRPKLVEIWAKYGRTYGKEGKRKRKGSEQAAFSIVPNLTLPNLTNLTNQTKEKREKKEKPPFVAPAPGEVEQYAQSIGFPLNGARFVSYYEARGWKIGRTPMASWKHAVNTWKQRDQDKLSPDERWAQEQRARLVSERSVNGDPV
jgi:hypothetical protein